MKTVTRKGYCLVTNLVRLAHFSLPMPVKRDNEDRRYALRVTRAAEHPAPHNIETIANSAVE
jgi:hypothetical protein